MQNNNEINKGFQDANKSKHCSDNNLNLANYRKNSEDLSKMLEFSPNFTKKKLNLISKHELTNQSYVNVSLKETEINLNNEKSNLNKVKDITKDIKEETGNDISIKEYKENQEDVGEDVINIIETISKEWNLEYQYIIDNGFNGYNNKKLKESKIISGHAELENGNNKLILYGNSLEVLDHKEFFEVVSHLEFQYFNIDILTNTHNINKLKNFLNLKKLTFSDNNIHSFYQLIKLEDFSEINYLNIKNNEVCNSYLLKHFLIYRFHNLKFFNDVEINQKQLIKAKQYFEYFDKCISDQESCLIENHKINLICKEKEPEKLQNKMKLLVYIKSNLSKVIEDLLEEDISNYF